MIKILKINAIKKKLITSALMAQPIFEHQLETELILKQILTAFEGTN